MEKKNISVLTPPDLHKKVEQRMYAETGKINFTQLVLAYFERYAAGEVAADFAPVEPPTANLTAKEQAAVDAYLAFLRSAPKAEVHIVQSHIATQVELAGTAAETRSHKKASGR